MNNYTKKKKGKPMKGMYLLPNFLTSLSLLSGFYAIIAAMDRRFTYAAIAIFISAIFDMLDGRVARMTNSSSRFGVEYDSLSDVIAFGVAPAMILFLWSLADAPKFGWTAALALAVCCALRLARFNSRMDADFQPHKSAGFMTGIPAPAGAGLSFVPVYLWLVTGNDLFREWYVVMPWALGVAMLMISAIPTYRWSSIRLRRSWRLFALAGVGLLGAALVTAPWQTLLAVCALYLVLLPFGIASYAKVRRRG